VTLASSFPPRFSWDAVRVPLFLAWSGAAPEVVQAASTFWTHDPNRAPAWVDLRSGSVAEYGICPGVQAIGAIAQLALSSGRRAAQLPSVAKDTYYSAALTLLSRMARAEMMVSPSDA
jgi:endoglucanase